ncbi:glycerophosphodiester phosphodiesterase 1 [Anopheles funestus]|uniref:glycerophosphodiester phosphodiesterase 1 n=1 Tax=Anopheles funestus TaxID=62324 RepID=UPI000859AE33|nr:glycerophosphodiester phosphodiesterase 1 [Anopheles funestus]
MYFATILKVCKMLYQLFWFLAACCTFIVNTLWLCCNFASVGIPWLMLLLFLVCIGSKFVKLKSPADDVVLSMLTKNEKQTDGNEALFWPIVNRGGAFDAPENSLAAINQCLSQRCQKILLDLGITSDGKAIILHRSTLEKANVNEPMQKLNFGFFDNFNISEHHPLGQLFQPEKVLTFERLLKLLESSEVTVFLLASQINSTLLEIVRETASKCPIFTKRIVFCCSAPSAIYQLRQHCPDLVCGLWMERSCFTILPRYLNTSTILLSIVGAIYRNIIAPVIGVSLVFIHKDEFNAQISTLWKNVGVRPIVYTINSPNEKRYFQQVTKTLYLTDSLRSEPQLIFKPKRK